VLLDWAAIVKHRKRKRKWMGFKGISIILFIVDSEDKYQLLYGLYFDQDYDRLNVQSILMELMEL